MGKNLLTRYVPGSPRSVAEQMHGVHRKICAMIHSVRLSHCIICETSCQREQSQARLSYAECSRCSCQKYQRDLRDKCSPPSADFIAPANKIRLKCCIAEYMLYLCVNV